MYGVETCSLRLDNVRRLILKLGTLPSDGEIDSKWEWEWEFGVLPLAVALRLMKLASCGAEPSGCRWNLDNPLTLSVSHSSMEMAVGNYVLLDAHTTLNLARDLPRGVSL